MKRTFSKLWLLSFVFCSFCTNNLMDSESVVVQMAKPSNTQKISDLIKIEGFTLLDAGSDVDLRGISKALFKEEKIVVLNQVGDKQDVWVFDEKTGKFLNKIGKQSNEPDGYDGMNDISFDGNEIRCTVGGKLSFMNYDMNGNLRSVIPIGVFGEELEKSSNNEFVVYNEYNTTDISGLNHLVFYDKKGNVTKKMYPYLKAQDNNGYAFAGSLNSSNGLWFNPPFCDTVFEIVGHQLKPRFFFDFEGKSMPENIRQRKMDGWDTDKYSFLNDGFVKVGRFLVFEYHDDQRMKLGAFEETSGQFISFRDMKTDYLYELIQLGDLYPKDQNTFALVLRPSRVKYMLEKNLLDLEGLNNHNPKLVSALKSIKMKETPIILYLAFTGTDIADSSN